MGLDVLYGVELKISDHLCSPTAVLRLNEQQVLGKDGKDRRDGSKNAVVKARRLSVEG